MTTYQVVGHCAHVTTVDIAGGKQTQLLYKGSMVPDSATPKEIEHLLSIRAITPVGGEPFNTHEVGAVAGGDVRTGLDGNPVQSVEPGVGKPVDSDEAQREAKAAAELEQKREAARAKLPADGSEPDGRAGKDVWVEHLAANGYDYDELVKQDKAELQKLARQQS